MEEGIETIKHNYSPKHIKLKDEEVQELLKKYNISLKQLPRIKSNDPAIKAFDLKPEDVVRIMRKSHTAKQSVYYRVVVKSE